MEGECVFTQRMDSRLGQYRVELDWVNEDFPNCECHGRIFFRTAGSIHDDGGLA